MQDLSEFGLTKDHVVCFFQEKHGNAALMRPWLSARRAMERETRREEEPGEESQAAVVAVTAHAHEDNIAVVAATHGQ